MRGERCARQSPSGSAAMLRLRRAFVPVLSLFARWGVRLASAPASAASGWRRGVSRAVSGAADLYIAKRTPYCHLRKLIKKSIAIFTLKVKYAIIFL